MRGESGLPGGTTRGVLTGAAQSLVASVLPLALALVALPVLARALGAERLALLTLAWGWLAFAALLDLGLGRALVRRLAEADAHGALAAERAAVATAQRLLLAAGTMVGVAGAIAGTWYVRQGLALPPSLVADATWSALLLAAAVPPTAAAAAPRAVLEAGRRFGELSAVRLVVNAASFAVPLALLPLTRALWPTALVLLVVRGWAWWALARRARPLLAADDAARRAPLARDLLRDGTWITVSNVLSPLLTTVDRFLVGGVTGAAAVAHYTVPYEAVTRTLVVPGALATALFPSAAHARVRGAEALPALHALALRAVAAVLLPLLAAAAIAAPTVIAGLGGADWPAASARVLAWLALGTGINALAMVPYTVLQAAGRARAIALLHLAEVVPYLVALVVLVRLHGIEGAAIAWTARVAVDAAVLARIAARHAPPAPGTWARLGLPVALLAVAAACTVADVDVAPWAAVALVAGVTASTFPREVLGAARARLARVAS